MYTCTDRTDTSQQDQMPYSSILECSMGIANSRLQIKLARMPGTPSRVFALAVDAAYDVLLAVSEQSIQCSSLHVVCGIRQMRLECCPAVAHTITLKPQCCHCLC